MLCEASVFGLEMRLSPATVFIKTPKGQSVFNLSFDRSRRDVDASAKVLGDRAWSFLKTSLLKSNEEAPLPSPLHGVCLTALDAVAEALRFGSSVKLDDLVRRAEDLGLMHLSKALGVFITDPNPSNGLRVAYLASESIRLEAMTA
jgi:hypothetical protein